MVVLSGGSHIQQLTEPHHLKLQIIKLLEKANTVHCGWTDAHIGTIGKTSKRCTYIVTSPVGPARVALVLWGGVWTLQGTKGCPSQNTAAADVLPRIPTASAPVGADRWSYSGGCTKASSFGQQPCPGKHFP